MALQRMLGLAVAALLCHGVIASPLGSASGSAQVEPTLQLVQTPSRPAPRKLHGRFLHITDLHPDDFYQVHSSTDETDACHRGRGPAGSYGAETTDCDSPPLLINATFDWIAANLRDQVDFVVWTGDSARHDSDEAIPRSQSQVLGSNRWVADKFIQMFGDASGDRLPIPVVPTLGNNDILPHNILLPGPNKWLQHYTDVWRRFIPEEQRHSFEFGGWFYVEVIPNKLAVFSLNTLYFFDRNAGVDDCASPSEPGYKQMEWLRVQLQFMRERGMKAIMMGHVPPARTDSKKLWAETCWQKYTLWLQQYRDVVTGSVYGHMNIDHFLIQDTKDIDLSQLSGPSANMIDGREPMGDELSTESATDYLQELRDNWSKLDRPATVAGQPGDVDEDKNKKKKKGKKPKKKDPWGERYQLSFVSPSVVPTYFPTLRVYEYNISGLEQTALWADAKAETNIPAQPYENDQKHLDLRGLSDSDFEVAAKRKKPKKKHPKSPNFVMPEPPAKTSPPGPAYSPQPLTLTGYVQYFANLTEINNLTLDDSIDSEVEAEEPISWIDWILRWHQGKHGGKKPRSPHPQPREFKFQVEYTTRDDKIYKLGDLTVNSFVDLAYRIGQRVKGNTFEVAEVESDSDDEGVVGDLAPEDEDSDSDSDDDELEIEKKKGRKEKDKKKKKKNKKSKKQNRTWLHFLDHAFVGTVEKRDLKKIS